ncbi:hypothetical protein Nepgr_002078 [Nepenthes gracilis]|uniref:Pesticidal crystal cry8Ba protein n=1 Tax=Nepenthes gracilis TaxID=150966 RepID=A0AAD3P5K8_NEPGR|nr:hypothetical protein Nepgr_002078 [Nepenthes gracilis]
MFTQGLDNNALKWVREGSVRDEVPLSFSKQRARIDPILNTQSASRGFGLPSTGKFRSGHLPPGAIPVSGLIPENDSVYGSDNDITSEEEEDAYGGRYSLDSSPQEDRVPCSSNYRYSNTRPLPRRPNYASDYTYSDVNSSVEVSVKRDGNESGMSMKENGRYPVGRNGYMEVEDESSDSAASSELSSMQMGSNIGTASHSKANISEGYTSSATSRMNIESATEKQVHAKNTQNRKFFDDDDTPSAPPFSASGTETNQNVGCIPVPVAQNRTYGADSNSPLSKNEENNVKIISSGFNPKDDLGNKMPGPYARNAASTESAGSSGSHAARLPTFHASTQGPWHSVIAYDACVRLCLNAWARSCMEAPIFLENECALLRNAFGLQQTLLQSEEEILAKRTSELATEGAAPKPKKMIGKMKVQVRKVRMGLDPPTGCSFASLKAPTLSLESARNHLSNLQIRLSSGWQAVRRICLVLDKPAGCSFSRKSLAYVQAGTQYIKQVSGLLKVGVTTLRQNSSSFEPLQESHSCLLRIKSSPEDDAVRMQPGSGETHVFFPDGLGDDLIVEVQDSKGKTCGRVVAQVATVADDPSDKLRWWSIYQEPEHELVGKIQLYINFSKCSDENSHLKCGSVAETVAYDLVLEVAMKVQQFQQRNLLLHGQWKWLLEEFASYYGVSDAYTKLRYLSYVMDVATPTADCLTLVYELLYPVAIKGNMKSTLSHQENRILGEVQDQIEQILALVFENYKSLDETLSSGVVDVFKQATGLAAPALEPAVKLYTLLHDILTPEAQTKLCRYFQAAAKKRSKRHLAETDEFVATNNEGTLLDNVTMATAYQKMKTLCLNIRNEVFTDIQIHNHHILPSFIDLPNLSASIYSVELCYRVREFLIACPPTGPSPPVAELLIATSDFQRDLANWNISPIKGGVDAKELFHLYIVVWIKDKRAAMLESCKLDKVKWSGVRTQHSTTPFVDDMYERLKDMLNDYEVIICRWPEYTFVLENAIADVEKATVEALDKQYADVLSPLKENLMPKKFGLRYVQKLTKRSVPAYVAPDELGILLNSLKRMLDVLRPKIEAQFKSWGSCIQDGGGSQVLGERLSEVTVMLRAKFRNYVQAVVEKLAENTRLQNATKLKKILQDSKESVSESEVRMRMQLLKEQLTSTMNHLHSIFETHVFIAMCRGFWDRMGQDILTFLENRKENRSWYKGCRSAVSILDDTFASQMQQLLGNSLQEKDIEPPRSILEVHSMLCKDAQSQKDNTFYF